jgi:hypothetical protein
MLDNRGMDNLHRSQVPRNALRLSLIASLIASLSGLLGACASSPRLGQPEAPLAPPPRSTDSVAYASPKLALAEPVRASWSVRGEDVDVTIVAPAERGPFPLVLYLPGLGESSAAGTAWRKAWAEAGYAVLSAQARATGTQVWSAERARTFDFRAVALEHFSARAVAARAPLVDGVLAEIGRRQQVADASVARIDASRVAVAGFDVGALSAMVVAGQSVAERAAAGPSSTPAIRAVIALSPYADFAGMGTEARFRDIRLPVLSVTSPEDTDAYRLVTTAAVRRAPFQYMPPGRKYLLLLAAGPHALLGGQERPGAERGDAARAPRRSESLFDSNDRGARGTNARPRGDALAALPATTQPDSNMMWALQLRNVQMVTTAFLDATVKDAPRAADWLARDAERWFAGSANLLAK